MTRVWHKAETKVDEEGNFWFHKACPSERVATVIQDSRKAQTKQSSKKNKWYAYLGGGAVDSEQTELLSGLVSITKNWQWGGPHRGRVLVPVVLVRVRRALVAQQSTDHHDRGLGRNSGPA